MTIKPEVLDALVAAGATAEMIAAAVKADMRSEEERLARKRANNAERQQRYRERHRNADNALQASHNAGNAAEPGEKGSPQDPSPKHEPQEKPPYGGQKEPPKTDPGASTKPARDTKGHHLPPDWQPSESDIAYGRNRVGLTLAEIEGMAEDMRLWAQSAAGQNSRKRSWSAAFRGWMRREAKKLGRKPPAKPLNGANGHAAPSLPPGWPVEGFATPEVVAGLGAKGIWPASWGVGAGYPGCRAPEIVQRTWLDENRAQRAHS